MGRVKHHSGVFIITTENPKYAELGTTIRLRAKFEKVEEGLIDPSSLTLRICEDGDVKATLSATRESKGVYYADHTLDETVYKVGSYVAEWSCSYEGKELLVRAPFNVKRTVG